MPDLAQMRAQAEEVLAKWHDASVSVYDIANYAPELARDVIALTDSAGELVRLRDSRLAEYQTASAAQTACIVKLGTRMRLLVEKRGKSEVGRSLDA